jgi:hypothetical protein
VDTGFAAALPLALAAAVSPGLLAIVLLILASDNRPKARAWSYLLGVVTVIVVVTLLGIVTLRTVLDAFGSMPPMRSAVIKTVLALVLFGLGWQYWRRPEAWSQGQRPWLLERLRTAGPALFYALGVATMSTNWSTLLLYLAALELVSDGTSSATLKLLSSCVVFLITIAPLLLPVAAVSLSGHRADRLLSVLGDFTNRHSRLLVVGIYFVLATVIAASALSDVASYRSATDIGGIGQSAPTSWAKP